MLVTKYFPAPKSADDARHQANVLAKAERLQREGYTFCQIDDETVFVTKPDGTKYEVDLIFEECTCPGHKADGYCSHFLGTLLWIEENEQIARMEEEEAGRLFIEACAAEHSTGYRF